MLKYPHLFEPIEIAGALFRNRIIAAPTGYQDMDREGIMPDAAAAYYGRKAQGGAAAVTIGECVVDSDLGRGAQYHVRMDDPFALHSLAKAASAISMFGAVASAELQHAGMYANRGYGITGEAFRGMAYGPVDYEIEGRIILAMTEEIIERTIRKYADAAAFAKKCGFGMVTIHGGHGWLLSQFLSPTLNTRKDKWGGASIENRSRLAVAIIDAVRKAVGPKFPIEVRISGSECYAGGYGIDEGIAFAKQLDGHCDIIHVSAGSHEVEEVFTVTHPSMFLEDGVNVKYAAEIKKHVKTTVATVGALGNSELMEDIIASGKADIVEIARGIIADPDLPNKIRSGREGEIKKCMRCLACFSNLINKGQFHCAINPETGRELEYKYALPASEKKTVLIAGGGIGGMQAALTCASRGHRVILCEKSGELGGALRCERNVPFKQKLDYYLNQQAELVRKAAIDLRLSTEVTPELARAINPDVIIAATGARPVKPPINGIDNKNVFSAEEIYISPEKAGENVVILGAGLVGVELGIYLSMLGRRVTIVEMLDKISDGGNMLHVRALNVEIKKHKIDLRLSTKAEEITEKGVVAGGKLISADTVIYAVGQKPQREAALALRDCAPEFWLLGDCIAPQNIMNATSSADMIARRI
jgi:2,4-dienoyl-CoA reductase-like NADH-dependent reductase (Old Yellow Enzyme family)/thioredoxin reductase